MAHSMAQVYLHLIFSTKNQYPFLLEADLRENLYAYLAAICRKQGAPALKVGGAHDHVHIACRFSRTLTIADLLYEVKRESSKWVKRKDASLSDFYWQQGYGAFSVGQSGIDSLCRYIDKQEKHHRTESFKREFLRFLNLYEVEYDERYVWE